MGGSDTPVLPFSLGPISFAQREVLRHVAIAAQEFLKFPDEAFDLQSEKVSLLERRISYSGDCVSVKRELTAHQVIPAWPKVGDACVVAIRDVIDAHLRAEIDHPEACLLPGAELPSVTPRSKVYSNNSEWHLLCEAACARGLFVPIAEDKIFRNQFGDLITCGAMGVDKFKEVDGVITHLLRFICILTPINAYMRKFRGDSWSLPQAALLSTITLLEDEVLLIDSENLQSCFNLFFFPESWYGYFAFSKKVSMAAFGGSPSESTWVAMRGAPMGWINTVDLIQNFIRRLVFQACEVPSCLEVNHFLNGCGAMR